MIRIEGFCKSYGENKVYENFDLEFDEGGVTCILGESGCGKTTLLNAIGGLISYEGRITGVKCSMVFQTPRLVPELTALGNLKLIGVTQQAAEDMLCRVGLKDRAGAYAFTLSGGEAQRVALCRAFLHPSELLLLDEPFSSLDLRSKLSAMELFKELRAESGRGALFVTHDVDEALYLSDVIHVLREGKIAYTLRLEEGERQFARDGGNREILYGELLKEKLL